ncbi:MAG: aldo/keto reductase [Chitinophagaceae bacterium]
MQYKQLGTSDLQVSEIGFGCMSLEEKDNNELLHQAIGAGINFFDTADLYRKGLNEEMVGKALKGKRSQVILATKVGNQWRSDGSGWDWNPRKDYILSAAEKSLQRLQTGHIDLYQLHGGTIDDPMDETIEAFELLQQQGKIRYYGISSIRPNVIREYVRRSRIVSVMMQYSLLDRRPESCGVTDLLRQHRIGILARGSLAQGLLAGKPAKSFLNYTAEQVKDAAGAIGRVAGESYTTSQVGIGFALHHPAITSAVAGIRTAAQLAAITGGLGLPALSERDMDLLARSIPVNHYDAHL